MKRMPKGFVICSRSRQGARASRWRLLILLVVAELVLAASVQGQPGPPRLRRPFIAVTHTLDYLQRLPGPHRIDLSADKEHTRTTIVAINGTTTTAQVAIYVIGNGTVFHKDVKEVAPGQEVILLPFAHFGTDPAEPPSAFDAVSPPYRGETIVVSATAPVIVTGTVKRGYTESYFLDTDSAIQAVGIGIRILDVRQYDCHKPEDFQAIATFCQTYLPL